MSDIKTATLDASELPAGTMKMVEVGEGKVLVSNVKGEIVSYQYAEEANLSTLLQLTART